ncbi:MAG: ribbon-helix-helix domain-containing protein [Solirubrobacteraceae bacterium]|nr:ribbon-helix-helix domain-containing protein [Solirubrobacteraceae bacterium]
MQSTIVKRSVIVKGHKTSVSLEDIFWTALRRIAAVRKKSLAELVGEIEDQRTHANLSSAIRLYVLKNAMSEAPRHPHDLREFSEAFVAVREARGQPAR